MNLLISSLDNKFIIEIIEKLKQDYKVMIDIFGTNNKNRKELLKWADIILCEWCGMNAIWYSRNKKSNQKLIIRPWLGLSVKYSCDDSFVFKPENILKFLKKETLIPG